MSKTLKDYVEGAKKIIEINQYCTIATATTDGKPWISPVCFGYDENYNIYWVSSKVSLHSRLINGNPRVAIVIFDSRAPSGQGDGVYFEAEAREVEDISEIERAISFYNRRIERAEFRLKSVAEVTGEGAWRIYRATPVKISKLTEGEFINGQYVDKRIEIDLAGA